MIKTGCIFDREVLQKFYSEINTQIVFDNMTMFFSLSENEKLIGIVRMFPKDNRCMILDADKSDALGEMEEEFLFKSAINFALTFNTEEILMTKTYEKYLLPMGFTQFDENHLIGKTKTIDFPSNCKHNKI